MIIKEAEAIKAKMPSCQNQFIHSLNQKRGIFTNIVNNKLKTNNFKNISNLKEL